ncbi:MAG: FHA domain-containing protein, partial [Chloroflexi bacterium]|nr:FHA domain-containing protein [Chloroflexota bacterium]
EVSALSRFEQFVESVVEGSFARLARGQLQPVEIAKRLARAMEREQTITAGKTIVPNEYKVALNPEDFRHFDSSVRLWERELAEYLSGVARERGLTILGQLIVTLEEGPGVPAGNVHVASRLVDRPAVSAPAEVRGNLGHTQRIDVAAIREAAARFPKEARLVLASGPLAGVAYIVGKPVVLIGRAMDNDVVLEEPRVSRYHAELRFRGDQFQLRDLKSTNGTKVNGEAATERVLHDGDRLSLGGVDLIFQIGH